MKNSQASLYKMIDNLQDGDAMRLGARNRSLRKLRRNRLFNERKRAKSIGAYFTYAGSIWYNVKEKTSAHDGEERTL